MPPPSSATQAASQAPLSPAELAYLHGSLSLSPPIRPDLRAPTQFRPLVAETDILPSANGSARVCFADGSEAIVGVKAEVEKCDDSKALASSGLTTGCGDDEDGNGDGDGVGGDGVCGDGGDGGGWGGQGGVEGGEEGGEEGRKRRRKKAKGNDAWVEISIDMPGFRDDDALPVFLAAMLNEALLASGDLPGRLCINRRYHWRLFIDVRYVTLVVSLSLLVSSKIFCAFPFWIADSLWSRPVFYPSSTSTRSLPDCGIADGVSRCYDNGFS